MNKAQFEKIAKDLKNDHKPYSEDSGEIAYRFCERLHNREKGHTIFASYNEVLATFRYQCLCLGGGIDMDEFTNLANWMRRHVILFNV
jgi:sulfur relay (sulfurtransferase) complex TusBCD TusD component (DsrE family)